MKGAISVGTTLSGNRGREICYVASTRVAGRGGRDGDEVLAHAEKPIFASWVEIGHHTYSSFQDWPDKNRSNCRRGTQDSAEERIGAGESRDRHGQREFIWHSIRALNRKNQKSTIWFIPSHFRFAEVRESHCGAPNRSAVVSTWNYRNITLQTSPAFNSITVAPSSKNRWPNDEGGFAFPLSSQTLASAHFPERKALP
jgi:hypothetical protein